MISTSMLLSSLTLLAIPPTNTQVTTTTTTTADGDDVVMFAPQGAADSALITSPQSGRWIDRWAPERGMLELGMYAGIYMPGRNHELFEARLELPDQGFKPYRVLAPEFGLRAAYFPLRWAGIELEGGMMPSATADGQFALMWTARGSAVLQIPKWSVVPFLLAGPGALGVASDGDVVGNDVDPALHFGGGFKINLNRFAQLRLDLRDVVSYKQNSSKVFRGHNFEALLGLSFTLGRAPRSGVCKGPSDSDGDGLFDHQDRCPAVPGPIENHGCPVMAKVEVDPDTDGDGFHDSKDSCINDPETANGYQDSDGCPDEMPAEVVDFSGVFEGVYFDTASDKLKPKSFSRLQNAVDVLTKYPDIRVGITGHTDIRGDGDYNRDLSRRRANAVKSYLEDNGVNSSRLETRGAGPDEPIADNQTNAGRAKNRRIEFSVLK